MKKKILIMIVATLIMALSGCGTASDLESKSSSQAESTESGEIVDESSEPVFSSDSKHNIALGKEASVDKNAAEIREHIRSSIQSTPTPAPINTATGQQKDSSKFPEDNTSVQTPPQKKATIPAETAKPIFTTKPDTTSPPEPITAPKPATPVPTATAMPTATSEPTRAPTPAPVSTEPPTPAFNISSWIGFAQSYGQSIGMVLDSTAMACWDNPIIAGAGSTNLEWDIQSILDWYQGDGYSYFCVWAEQRADGKHNLFIGYA